jgi:hypothetical protein
MAVSEVSVIGLNKERCKHRGKTKIRWKRKVHSCRVAVALWQYMFSESAK